MSINENGEGKKPKSRQKSYIIVVVVLLVVGLAFGSLFGGAADLFARLGNGEQGDVGQISGEISFEEAKPRLEQELRQRKENEILMQHLDDLIVASNIEISLDVIGTGDEGAVVAMVNREEIKKEELLALEEQEKQQLVMMGLDPESEEAAQMMEQMRPQILDNLIANKVLMQKIEEDGVSASEVQVEEHYQQYAAQFGGEEMLEQQLEQAGLTKDDLKQEIYEQLPIQIYVENYLAENLSEDELVFPESELKELYEAQQQQMELQS